MIVSASEINGFVNSVANLSDNDPFACRIISFYNSYAPDLAFVDYWLINDNLSGKCTGAIARSGTAFILLLNEDTDTDEVSSFMRVAGASSVICNAQYKLDLFESKSITGPILVKNTPYENIDEEIKIIQPDIRSAYNLIVKCADNNFVPPDFEDYYVDVNHKLRHNAMRICGICKNEKLAAVAMTVAESKNGAVLGAVACDPQFRKRGYGSHIVKHLSNQLINEGKTVYLHRAKNSNKLFYENLGFKESGEWREYYF